MADTLKSFFAEVQRKIDPDKIVGMNATFQFIATGDDGGEWYVRIVDGQAEVAEGTVDNPNITLTATAQDWIDVMSGKLDGQAAFLMGKLKIEGDMTLAMKLQSILSL